MRDTCYGLIDIYTPSTDASLSVQSLITGKKQFFLGHMSRKKNSVFSSFREEKPVLYASCDSLHRVIFNTESLLCHNGK